MKKNTLMIFGTVLLAGGLLVGCVEEETANTEKTEEVKTEEVKAEKVEGVEPVEAPKEEVAVKAEPVEPTEKEIYTTTMKAEIERITTEYDQIWDEHWKPAWSKVEAEGDVESLKGELEIVEGAYGDLQDDLVALSVDQLTDNKALADEYRLNFSKSVLYRQNAARAVLQGINGHAEMNDRMEESMESIELADEYLIKAMSNLTELNSNLGI